MSDFVRSFVEAVLLLVAFLLVSALITVVGISVINRLSFPMYAAEIEQLRADVQKVTPDQGSHVYEKAAEWNMRIKNEQACNRVWYCDWTQTDRWNDVKLIEIPSLEKP